MDVGSHACQDMPSRYLTISRNTCQLWLLLTGSQAGMIKFVFALWSPYIWLSDFPAALSTVGVGFGRQLVDLPGEFS